MARIEWVKNRLENWALWAAAERSGGLGFASQSALLRTGPVEQTRESRVPIDEIDASITDEAVSSLIATHRDYHQTVVGYHINGLSAIGLAGAMGIGVATVHSRLASSDRLLAAWFSARSERQAAAAIEARPVVPTGVGKVQRVSKRSFTT
jgi:hypothetical protein